MTTGPFLLDTHALIWWWLADPKLSDTARDLIAGSDRTAYVSAVSAIEIAMKVRSGKLPALAEVLNHFDEALATDALCTLPIRTSHAIHAGIMPGRHRDPFDRLLAAQSLMDRLTLVTRDREIAAFGCKVFW